MPSGTWWLSWAARHLLGNQPAQHKIKCSLHCHHNYKIEEKYEVKVRTLNCCNQTKTGPWAFANGWYDVGARSFRGTFANRARKSSCKVSTKMSTAPIASPTQGMPINRDVSWRVGVSSATVKWKVWVSGLQWSRSAQRREKSNRSDVMRSFRGITSSCLSLSTNRATGSSPTVCSLKQIRLMY
jgi:hypothetical protein